MPGRLSGARGILGHRFVTGVCAFVVALVLLGNQAGALVASDHILISSRNDDVLAAANVSMVAWSQNTKAHPDRYNAYVRPLHGGFTQRLNAFGTTGFAGGFDGTEVIFQQIHAGQSNLRIFDTASGYVQTPRGVNTSRWERAPTMSGDYLLFNRDSYRAKWTTGRIVLHQISTGHEEILARFSGAYRDGDVYSGQVSGDFATWTRCARGVGACDVYIHRISTDHTMRVPNRAREYAASISADGTAFYMRDDKYCGQHAKLIELLNGHEHVVKSFARNRDAIDTYAVSESVLVHDLLNCKTHVSDVYETRIS